MDNFDLKKYLIENKITKTSLLRENEASIPEGWSESVIGPEDQDPELYGGELIKSYTAPMEGWDNEHLDIVNIIKKEDGTYLIDVYVAFGDHIEDENTTPYPTYEAAHARAVEIMEEFKDDWEDKGEEDGLDENKLNEGQLTNIESQLEDAGFNFEDGILGGVGSGGGGYYDSVSDKISGFDLDEFNENEFNEWYDNFSLDSFNSSDYDKETMNDYNIDINKISKIPAGFYNVGEPGYGGFAQIKDNGEVILYATPTLSDEDGEKFFSIFSIDKTGNVIPNMNKEKVISRLKQNLKQEGSWAII